MEKDCGFLRESVQVLAQMLLDLEAAEKIGAGAYERTPARVTNRNEAREREWDTRVGTVNLSIPKLRQGSDRYWGMTWGPLRMAFWLGFLRSLVARGLKGVKLVISDSHEGLKNAIQAVLQGAAWQRCRVHFVRNVLAHVPKSARAQLGHVAAGLEKRFLRAAEILL